MANSLSTTLMFTLAEAEQLERVAWAASYYARQELDRATAVYESVERDRFEAWRTNWSNLRDGAENLASRAAEAIDTIQQSCEHGAWREGPNGDLDCCGKCGLV